MQVIMELPENYSQITGMQQRDLQNGKVTLQVLKKVWSDHANYPLPEKSSVDVRKLSIILQAFCLIHPAMSDTQCSSEDPVDLHDRLFIVPSLLPEPNDSRKKEIAQNDFSWISFYFDFEKFLPLEVYHRLICMLIAETQKTRSKNRYKLSSSLCRFDKAHDCKWKIELEAHQHRIKISVMYVEY